MNFYALYLDVGHDNITLELGVLSRNMTWLNWLCFDLWISGVCVQILFKMKLIPLFLLNIMVGIWEREGARI